jgi:hypothetical protein
MLRATIWRDLRWRLLAAALLVVSPAALVAWSHVVHARRATPGGAAFLDATWFRLPGGSAVFLVAAVLLAASGSLRRPGGDVGYVLALPVSRRCWLLTHVAMSMAALTALVVIVHLVLATGPSAGNAPPAGASLGHGPLLARSLAVLVAASAWVGVTLAVLTLVRHALLAVVLLLGVLAALPASRFRLDLPPRAVPPLLPAWDPWAFADPRAWDAGVPVASISVAFALGVGGLLVALYRLERFEP